jgi:hypothetical protein
VRALLRCRGANLILSGAYDDFSTNWYVDVGQSLQIIIILNAMLTGGCSLAEQAVWMMQKCDVCFSGLPSSDCSQRYAHQIAC